MTQLRILVFPSDSATKPLLERTITLSTSVNVPFDSLIRDFRFLFGSSCVITFQYV